MKMDICFERYLLVIVNSLQTAILIEQLWLKSLYDEALADRQTQKRIRREIRALTVTERKRFFDAVNALKNDKTVYPNKYDVFALIHTNRTLCSVYGGTNFLSWHRVFLLLFETALRQKDKSVSLPYWNPVDIHGVIGSQNTMIFSESFLGNGHNVVNTGPFGNWTDFRGCPIVRDIGGRNTTPLSYNILNMIMNNASILRTNEVSEGGPYPNEYTIEGQYNLGLAWVGGTMNILNKSVNDPLFFLHQAFIDHVWEGFRGKQRRYGINPESDYQLVASVKNDNKSYNLQPLHGPNRTMDCFFWLKNEDGFWNNLTNLYEYEDYSTYPKFDFLTSDKSGNHTEANFTFTVEISVGGGVGLFVIVAIVFCICRRR